jgi:23S rRNA (adenine2503-C2)-methyltransferase
MKDSILNYTSKDLEDLIKPKFRVKQIYNWIYIKKVDSFSSMKNLPKNLREELDSKYTIYSSTIASKQVSSDGSIKYLFKLHDGHTVEAVLLLMRDKVYNEDGSIKHLEKYTVCVSSQVGCKVGCAFCLTAKGGFIRDLSAGEIVEQILYIYKDNNIEANRRINIVYMGMGEPLDNLDNLAQAVKIFNELDGLAISSQRQTVSTSGLSAKINRLAKMDLGINLAISLHAVDDKLRETLMPINKAYNIASIMDAVRNFPINLRKKVMFEYLIIKDLNDDLESSNKLVKLLNGINSKVNLIYFNPYEGSPFDRPLDSVVKKFQENLIKKGVLCTIRESKGLDISAACGQLREQNLNKDL